MPSDKLKVGDRITEAQKENFWRKDSAKALRAAVGQARDAGVADQDFILALADVNFQLGQSWRSEFKKTWALIKAGRYDSAAVEAQNSAWFRQTPARVRAFQKALLALPRKQVHQGK